jgi:hypothetical protein
MKVSINEVQRSCEKAAWGVGTPAGADTDTGRIVAWLAAHGLPGVALAARDLVSVANGVDLGAVSGIHQESGWQLDAGGRSFLYFAGAVLDLAIAEATRSVGGTSRVRITLARTPLFLVPLAAKAVEPGYAFRIGPAGRPARAWIIAAQNEPRSVRIAWRVATDLTDGEPADVDLAYGPRPGAASPFEQPTDGLDPYQLARRKRDAVATGVFADEADWAVIQRFAARTLVVASEESRRRGAGAEVDDNE